MSTASEKAADKMHADLEAMASDCARHSISAGRNNDNRSAGQWSDAAECVRNARRAVFALMSDRDRRIAGAGGG